MGGHPEAVRQDVAKVTQLSDRIDDFLAGRASIPKVDIGLVKRVWPLLLTSEGLPQTPTLWRYLEEQAPEVLQKQKVQPLTILDLENTALLFGMVEDGASLVEMLKSKTTGDYAERQLGAWRREHGHHDIPAAVAARFDLAWEAVSEAFSAKTENSNSHPSLSKRAAPYSSLVGTRADIPPAPRGAALLSAITSGCREHGAPRLQARPGLLA